MKSVGKIEIAESWLPKQTDNIAATGTDETITPKNIPIEQEIAIADKLIDNDSIFWAITYSGRVPKVI